MDAQKQIRLTNERILSNPVLSFSDWVDEHFQVHNPIASRRIADDKLEQWINAGARLPTVAIERFRLRGCISHSFPSETIPTPRVVGLVFDRDRNLGLVDPLITKRAAILTHSPLLPFSARAAQSLLLRICEELWPQMDGAVPESFGFDFSESLRENCIGNSMDVAALLSCLDAITNYQCDIFGAACAVVELGCDGALIPVRHLDEKLDAFIREYSHGSLLVVSPESRLAPACSTAFDNIWTVASIRELAAYIKRLPQVLSAIHACDPLRPEQIGPIVSRLRALEEQRDSIGVVHLCERISNCGFHQHVVLHERTRVQKYHADALRHQGRYRESLAVNDVIHTLLKVGNPLFSSEELMGHAVDRAAVLFDSCSFQQAYLHLCPWLDMCKEDPQRFTCEKRIELFNTIARCMIMLQIDGWQQLFETSIYLQRQIDPSNIRRTESYLCHGLLRANQLDAAESIIRQHESSMTGNDFVDGFTRFYRCELERRRVTTWPASVDELPQWPGYTYAFALQAIGRQQNRMPLVCGNLMDKAAQRLLAMCSGDDNILALIAHAVILSQAAILQDAGLWRSTCDWLQRHVTTLGAPQAKWFGVVTDSMGSRPSVEVAERLMRLMPYV